MTGFIIALIVTVFVAFLIVKKYQPQPVLLLGGIILIGLTIILGTGSFLPKKVASTGFVWFDVFELIKYLFSKRAASLGLIIMAAAGFAKYMDHIGASGALVRVAIKPLKAFHAPYLVLALGYVVGQILNIFIPSASGLGLLLMVTMYPVLVSLGVSPIAATALIGTSGCLDLGPASGNSNLAAKTAGIDVANYFVDYQIPVAIAVIITIALLHFLTQRYFDKKEGHVAVKSENELGLGSNGEPKKQAPLIYVILPILPLALILVFSKLLVSSIKMNVITAMLIGMFVSMVFEFVRTRDLKGVMKSILIFFDGMGVQFARVVTLIVAGETFAAGLKSIGAIPFLIQTAQGSGFGAAMMIIVMTAIISVSAVVMGSGNAPFFAFAALAPDVASKMGIASVSMLLPMQFASGIARSVSPITAVIVAVSGVSNVSPFEVIKRTAIPMAGGLIVTVIANFVLIGF